MSDIATMFREMQAQLAPAYDPPISGFPVSGGAKPVRQVTDYKHFSGVSRISGRPQWAMEISPTKAVQARAGASGRAGARECRRIEPEMPEMPEKPTGRGSYLSGSLSLNPEKEKETGNPPALRALLGLASDPDVQLAFDERAAFLEYECGLSRAEAEAQAASEILPELPAFGIAPALAPPAGSDLALWTAGLARLSQHRAPCPDYRGNEWPRVLANALTFLDTFGAQAEALGWQTHELFGVHPEIGTVRPDYCGALVLGVGGPVRLVTTDEIKFGHLTHRKMRGKSQGVPIWEFGR